LAQSFEFPGFVDCGGQNVRVTHDLDAPSVFSRLQYRGGRQRRQAWLHSEYSLPEYVRFLPMRRGEDDAFPMRKSAFCGEGRWM